MGMGDGVNSCHVRVGRLMEIDVAGGYQTVEDVDRMIGMIGAELGRLPRNVRIVIAADWRPCVSVFTPQVADRCVQMLTGVNPRVERSAIVHAGDSPISVMQVLRLVKEAHNESRRAFTKAADLEAWLGEVLNADERARLGAFLAAR